MVKSKVTLSIDPYTWEQAKNTYDSASQRIEELIEADIDASQIEDKELLERKKQELEEEIENLGEEIKQKKAEKSSKESELEAVKASLEVKKREEKERKKDIEKFKQVFERNYVDDRENADRYPDDGSRGWVKPDHIPEKWVERLDMSKQDLWERCLEAEA